jgi:hypothetical protein
MSCPTGCPDVLVCYGPKRGMSLPTQCGQDTFILTSAVAVTIPPGKAKAVDTGIIFSDLKKYVGTLMSLANSTELVVSASLVIENEELRPIVHNLTERDKRIYPFQTFARVKFAWGPVVPANLVMAWSSRTTDGSEVGYEFHAPLDYSISPASKATTTTLTITSTSTPTIKPIASSSDVMCTLSKRPKPLASKRAKPLRRSGRKRPPKGKLNLCDCNSNDCIVCTNNIVDILDSMDVNAIRRMLSEGQSIDASTAESVLGALK